MIGKAFKKIPGFRRWVSLLTLFTFFLVSSISGCAINPVTGKRELALISEKGEIQLGENQYPYTLQQGGGLYRDPELERYITEVGEKLGKVSHRPHVPYKFRIVNSSIPNAFALPGGPIAINRGLLVSLENEAQLAAVLGHEVGHVSARHHVQKISQGVLLNLALIVLGSATKGKGAQVLMASGLLAGSLLSLHFSREDEAQSDALGIDYMVRAGYNPIGAVQLQEFFYRKVEKEREPSWLEGLFRTHPFSKDRMEASSRRIKEVYPDAPKDPHLTLNEERFMRETAKLRRVNEVYKVFDEGERLLAKGYYQAATEKFREAIRMEPDQAPFYRGLGAGYLKMGDYGKAEEYLQRSLDLDWDFYLTHYYMGLIRVKRGDYQVAIAELDNSVRLLPTRPAFYYLGESHEAIRNLEEATRYYEVVVQTREDDEYGRKAKPRLEYLKLFLNPGEFIQVVSEAWTKEPSTQQASHTLTLSNRSMYPVRNIRLLVRYFSEKKREVDRREVIVPWVLFPGKTQTFSGIDVGPVHRKAATSKIEVLGVEVLRIR